VGRGREGEGKGGEETKFGKRHAEIQAGQRKNPARIRN